MGVPGGIISAVRLEQLWRRANALPKELGEWRVRTLGQLDKQAYYSQIQALTVLMEEYIRRQEQRLTDLQQLTDQDAFDRDALGLQRDIIKAQEVWNFFRQKLDLRFSPSLCDVLWVADTVAWDCYRPVLDAAAVEGILKPSLLREPPLIYLAAKYSAATWVRGSRPNDGRNYHLGVATLPIPVIELPWEHVENSWTFLVIHHEVGHDLEADFQLRQALVTSLCKTLVSKDIPQERIAVWEKWLGEVFADFVALQLGGPAFAEALADLLLLPREYVTRYQPSDPHPTHFVRVLLNAAYIRTMIQNSPALNDHAARIEKMWRTLYDEQQKFDGYLDDIAFVVEALMDAPMVPLNGKSVRELIPYTEQDDAVIRAAAAYLQSGQNKPQRIRPRHCVSAAQLALTTLAVDELPNVRTQLQEIHSRTLTLVRENSAPGLRSVDDTKAHWAFIAGFADVIAFID